MLESIVPQLARIHVEGRHRKGRMLGDGQVAVVYVHVWELENDKERSNERLYGKAWLSIPTCPHDCRKLLPLVKAAFL